MIPDKIEKLLRSLYYDPKSEAGYASIEKLYKIARLSDPHITPQDVRDWLASEQTYSLHAPKRQKFTRNRCLVEHVDDQWQADLVDMARFKRFNQGYTFILTVVDMFSKYAFTVPLRNKSGVSLKRAFEKIFDQGRIPLKLQTDKGTEFTNTHLQDYLKSREVEYFTTTNRKIKCALVERFNRTLKTRIFKYMTSKNSSKYIDTLQDFTESYNNSKHRTIKMRPIDVDPDDKQDEKTVFLNTYGVPSMRHLLFKEYYRKSEFEPGDEVRIALMKEAFTKGYAPQWSKETYKVVRCIQRIDRCVYEIKKQGSNHILRKKFYKEELQKITNNLTHIERVIRQRRRNDKTEYLVKFKNDSGEKNRWIEEGEVPLDFRKV